MSSRQRVVLVDNRNSLERIPLQRDRWNVEQVEELEEAMADLLSTRQSLYLLIARTHGLALEELVRLSESQGGLAPLIWVQTPGGPEAPAGVTDALQWEELSPELLERSLQLASLQHQQLSRRARPRLTPALLEREHLLTQGLLSNAVHHRLNNPLTYIFENLRFAQESSSDPRAQEEVAEALDDTLQGARQIQQLVQVFEAFRRASPAREELRSFHPHLLLHQALELASLTFKAQIHTLASLGPGRSLRGPRDRLLLALVQLLLSASRRIPFGSEKSKMELISEQTATGYMVHLSVQAHPSEPPLLPSSAAPSPGVNPWLMEELFALHQVQLRESLSPQGAQEWRLRFGGEPPREQDRSAERAAGELWLVDDEEELQRFFQPQLGPQLRRIEELAEVKERLSREARPQVILIRMLMGERSGMDLYRWIVEHHPALLSSTFLWIQRPYTASAMGFLREFSVQPLEGEADLSQILRLMSS